MTILSLVFAVLLILALIKVSFRKNKNDEARRNLDNVDSFDEHIP